MLFLSKQELLSSRFLSFSPELDSTNIEIGVAERETVLLTPNPWLLSLFTAIYGAHWAERIQGNRRPGALH